MSIIIFIVFYIEKQKPVEIPTFLISSIARVFYLKNLNTGRMAKSTQTAIIHNTLISANFGNRTTSNTPKAKQLIFVMVMSIQSNFFIFSFNQNIKFIFFKLIINFKIFYQPFSII
jgi:hypothetical protein